MEKDKCQTKISVGGESTEIRSLEIDFDRDLLKINGKEIKEIPVLVTLPGPEKGYPYRMLFNSEKATDKTKTNDKLEVSYIKG